MRAFRSELLRAPPLLQSIKESHVGGSGVAPATMMTKDGRYAVQTADVETKTTLWDTPLMLQQYGTEGMDKVDKLSFYADMTGHSVINGWALTMFRVAGYYVDVEREGRMHFYGDGKVVTIDAMLKTGARSRRHTRRARRAPAPSASSTTAQPR